MSIYSLLGHGAGIPLSNRCCLSCTKSQLCKPSQCGSSFTETIPQEFEPCKISLESASRPRAHSMPWNLGAIGMWQ